MSRDAIADMATIGLSVILLFAIVGVIAVVHLVFRGLSSYGEPKE